MAEQDTQTTAPGEGDVASAGHADSAAQSSKETAPSTTAETGKTEHRYLGKKYADINALEDAHHEALEKLNLQGEEKNAAVKKAEAFAKLAKITGKSEDELVAYLEAQEEGGTQAESPELDSVRKELRATRLKQAQLEEDLALDELIRAEPQLKDVRDEIRASWRLTNKPLADVAARFKTLVAAGRNEQKEDAQRKQGEATETGKGAGEASGSSRASEEKLQKAIKTGKLEDFADALPDSFSLNHT
jgi:hypothetical protein